MNNLITNVAESGKVLCAVKRTRTAPHVEAADTCRVCSHAQTQLLRQSTRAWRRSCGACKHHRCAIHSMEKWRTVVSYVLPRRSAVLRHIFLAL